MVHKGAFGALKVYIIAGQILSLFALPYIKVEPLVPKGKV